MNIQVEGLERKNTWVVVDSPPAGDKVIDSKRVFQWKTDEHGYVIKAKARLFFRGDRQEMGRYFNVFTYPFLNNQQMYMRLPPGLSGRSGTFVHLRNRLYGTRQAAREWFGELGKTLKTLGLDQSLVDPCIYRLMNGEKVKVLISAADFNLHFPTKSLGELVLYAGCEYRHDLERGTLELSQTAYIQRILDRVSITRTAATPAYVSLSFKVDEGEDFRGRYCEAVGSLMWLSSNARPDIADAVRAASRHNENPTAEDGRKVLRGFEYLRTTIGFGITYVRGSSDKLVAYADADYAKLDDRRPVSEGAISF
ncbi:unnamed protein product, partial [Sphacelaria rigidula]